LALAPASLIDEAFLADELDLGLTPIRQALQRLALENLVVVLPRRGTIAAIRQGDALRAANTMRVHICSCHSEFVSTRYWR